MKNNLKAISAKGEELRVGNYMVLFGGRDLAGEFFTDKTDFKSAYTDLGVLYEDFEHGFDPDKIGNDKNNVLGIVDWKSAKFDETGVYVERILNRRADYMKFIEDLIEAGIIGTSSAAIPGATTKKSSGEILEWPLMRDTLTVMPMEPRMAGENVLAAAKALVKVFPHNKSLAKLTGAPIIDRSHVKTIEEFTDFKSAEGFLRDACGLSRSEATAFFSRVKGLVQRDSAADAETKAVIAALSRRDELLKA
jgi:hypothetical protein